MGAITHCPQKICHLGPHPSREAVVTWWKLAAHLSAYIAYNSTLTTY